MTCKKQSFAKIRVASFAVLTNPTCNGWVDCDPLACLSQRAEFMPKYERCLQEIIANTRLVEPMQVRATDSHCAEAQYLLPQPGDRDGFFM